MQPDTIASLSSNCSAGQNSSSSNPVHFPALTRPATNRANQQLPNGLSRKSRQSREKLIQEIAQLYNPQDTQPDTANIQALIALLQSRKNTYSPINQQWINSQISMLQNELARTIAQATIEQLPSANSELAPTVTPGTVSQLEKEAGETSSKYLMVPEGQEIFAELDQLKARDDQEQDGLEEFEDLTVQSSDTQAPVSLSETAQTAQTSTSRCCIQ